MKALDTNLLVRLLVNDDKSQARRVRRLFEHAEATGGRFLITQPVILELLWVLGAVYDFTRQEVLQALELLTQMPVLEFEDFDNVLRLVDLGGATRHHLVDLLIGLAAKACGCETTLTLEKGLARSGLFEEVE